MRNDSAAQKRVSQHRAKRAKGPGARPWSGSRGETHCGYRAKPCRSMRQSLIRRQPTKRCREGKKKYKLSHQTNKYRRIKPAPLYYPPAQRKIRKERSDFAAQQTLPNNLEGRTVFAPTKKFIADRRYHNSSFLTPHSTNAAFFIKNLLQFQRYCAILIRYV